MTNPKRECRRQHLLLAALALFVVCFADPYQSNEAHNEIVQAATESTNVVELAGHQRESKALQPQPTGRVLLSRHNWALSGAMTKLDCHSIVDHGSNDFATEEQRRLCSKHVQTTHRDDDKDGDSAGSGMVFRLSPEQSWPSQVAGSMTQSAVSLHRQPGDNKHHCVATRNFALDMDVLATGRDMQRCRIRWAIGRDDETIKNRQGFQAGEINWNDLAAATQGKGQWKHVSDGKVVKDQKRRRESRDVAAHDRCGDRTVPIEIEMICPYFPGFPQGELAISNVTMRELSVEG